jgi:hypothetical protein
MDWVRTVPPNLASLSDPSRSTVKGAPDGGGTACAVAVGDAEVDAAAEALADGLGVARFRSMACPVSWKAVTIAGMKYATAPIAPDSTNPNAIRNPRKMRVRRT